LKNQKNTASKTKRLTSSSVMRNNVRDDMRGVHMHEKEAKLSVSVIAALTGLSRDKVRRDQREGWFSLDDIESTVRYTHAHMVLGDMQPVRSRRDESEAQGVQSCESELL
jgi:hypothetical protein